MQQSSPLNLIIKRVPRNKEQQSIRYYETLQEY